MLEKVSIVLGVASRDVVEFGAFDEILARVGARRLEQTILQAGPAHLRREEGLSHPVRDGIGDLRRGEVADDVLSLLGDDALTYSEWLGKAEEKLFTSRDTFKRRLRKLKSEGRIRESAAEEGKYVRA